MTFLALSFLAGLLTVLAPCILPLLPVVIGSAASGRSRATPYIVVLSLSASIIIFTYGLKVSTAFIMVPPELWTSLSGGILVFFGLTILFPALWANLPGLSRLAAGSNRLVGSGYQRKSLAGDIIIGAALGPVFSTCSPTYFVILASVLPASFALGTLYLLAYVLGLGLILLLVALLGQRLTDRLASVADSRSLLRRSIGVLFIVLGLLIALGREKRFEAWLLEHGFDITTVEQTLLRQSQPAPEEPGQPYQEIVDPSGFVNTEPITIGQFIGSKVILIDFLTYSCINCQRTFPYLNAWDEQYRDQGLLIIGIHTPEFAFEKNIDNVRAAMEKFGITHPIVLDNDYATWNAYGNHYWPRRYLIDIHGAIVYDHIGEGAYDETEQKIRELLGERARVLGEPIRSPGPLRADTIAGAPVQAQSPETYFGASRNTLLGNGRRGVSGPQTLSIPPVLVPHTLYLGGTWNLTGEYATNVRAGATIAYRFDARNVYFVAGAATPVTIHVSVDGRDLGTQVIQANTLYPLVSGMDFGEHTLEIIIDNPGLDAYTFTFG